MRVLIMAGGTGGHIFPALAVAEVLRARGHDIDWLGTPRGLENELVPRANIPLHHISITGLRGKGKLALLLAPVKLLRALWQALKLVRRVNPAVVLGMGGFASGPGGVASWLLRKPLIVHEQNAIAGFTNRMLSRIAAVRLEAFPDSLSAARRVGNPVRREIETLTEPAARFASRTGPLRVLILGGSQGAHALNNCLPTAFSAMESTPDIWHQCGARWQAATVEAYRQAGVDAKVEPFIDDMAHAYGWADLVICRAGAMSVCEVAAAGVAALFVPYPHAVDDHQSVNARFLVDAGAASLLPESDLTTDKLPQMLKTLQKRETLAEMAIKARSVAVFGAAEKVADCCIDMAINTGGGS